MPITDLTGTTWVLNSNPDFTNIQGNTFYLDFSSNNRNFTMLDFPLSWSGINTIEYTNGGKDFETVYSYPSWLDQAYRTISITGSTDATNTDLIAWLQANATQQTSGNQYEITETLTNLTSGNKTIQITPDTGYYLPSSITVTNGTLVSYNSTTGIAVISGDNAVVTAECSDTPPAQPNYLTFETDDGSEFTLGTDANDYGTVRDYVFNSDGTFEYSTDTTNWYSWTPTTSLQSVNGKLYLRGSNNTYLSTYSSCFLQGTKITLADGSTKNVEDITYNDRLKVWNFDTGEYDTANICWITKPKLKNYHYYQLTFNDGTILKTTGKNSNHKVYNVDERYFKGVNITEVGDRVFTENGIVTVVDKQYIKEEVLYHNLITSRTFCCFANGVLTSDRYGNTYPIDENMMFIKDERPIRPYSEFEEVGISRYWYDNLRLGEQTETLERTQSYIQRLEGQMLEVN